MKVLLIQPPPGINSFVSKSGVPEPLALEILAASSPNHNVKIYDMRLDKASLRKKIEEFQPKIAGIGCLTAGYYECLNIFKEIKTIDPEIITIVGGHHATLMPHDFSKSCIDFIVMGEGEQTFKELLDTLELNGTVSKVNGLAIPQNGILQFTGERSLIKIDDMPIPNRMLTMQYRNKYFRGSLKPYASLVASRGCPFRCKFCCQWVFNKGTYRVRNPEKITEELVQIQEPYVDFTDDNSWADANWMNDLYQKIKETGIRKEYKLYARSDLITKKPDLIEKWKQIGLKAVLIGFESFKDEDLKKWEKKTTVSQNVEATEILKNCGVEIVGYFMVDPSFSENDFLSLQEHVNKLDIDQPIFSILTPFPGTLLYEELKDKILTTNYEFYDGMHAIIPTKLPIRKFYKLYTDLFRNSYPKAKLIRKLLKGKISFSLPQAIAQKRYLRQLADIEVF